MEPNKYVNYALGAVLAILLVFLPDLDHWLDGLHEKYRVETLELPHRERPKVVYPEPEPEALEYRNWWPGGYDN